MIVTIAAALLFLGGLQPFNVAGASPLGRLGGWVITILVVVNVTLAVDLLPERQALDRPVGLLRARRGPVGAVRLARPGSPWSRRYRDNPANATAPSAATSARPPWCAPGGSHSST